jgi:hypothetical protein
VEVHLKCKSINQSIFEQLAALPEALQQALAGT